jgi:hypothetical protein
MNKLLRTRIRRFFKKIEQPTDDLGLTNRVFKVPEPVHPGLNRGPKSEYPDYVREQVRH